MINKIAFSGRETMLTPTGKIVAKMSEELAERINNAYVGVGKHYSTDEINNAKALAQKAISSDNTAAMDDSIASYRASHQPILNKSSIEPASPVAEHIDFFG